MATVVAAKLDYHSLLQEVVHGHEIAEDAAGLFFFEVPPLRKHVKRGDERIFNLPDKFQDLPTLNYNSLDRSSTLQILKEAAETAYEHKRYGDFFYLWQVMLHNGNSALLDVLTSTELQDEVKLRLGDSPEVFELLASSLTLPDIENFYRQAKVAQPVVRQSKRDLTVCSFSNLARAQDCDQLMVHLESGRLQPENVLNCYRTCCAAWSKRIHIYNQWIRGKVGWCKEKCIENGYSCKINNVAVFGWTLNFCTSSIPICT